MTGVQTCALPIGLNLEMSKDVVNVTSFALAFGGDGVDAVDAVSEGLRGNGGVGGC